MKNAGLLRPGLLIPIAVVVVILLGIGIAVVGMMLAKKKQGLFQVWVRGAFSIWTGGEDSATWAAQRAQQSLQSWYGITGPGKLWEVIKDLKAGTTGNVAWDRVRALDILRIAVAAGIIDNDQCYTEARSIVRELQSAYRDWESLAQGFEQGMNAWQRSRGVTNADELGRVQKNLPVLRQQIWPQVPYNTDFSSDDLGSGRNSWWLVMVFD